MMSQAKNKLITLWHERHVQEFVRDRIVVYLQCNENLEVTMVLVDQLFAQLFVHQSDDRNQLLIVQFSINRTTSLIPDEQK